MGMENVDGSQSILTRKRIWEGDESGLTNDSRGKEWVLLMIYTKQSKDSG
jgi:hypothetical protein